MSIRVKLLSAISACALGFVVFALLSWHTVNTTRVNGEWYQRIVQGKDLIADVLPPPEYIIEAYLVVFQMVEETNEAKLRELVEKSKSLREDYERQHQYWAKSLPEGKLKEEFLTTSYEPALKFFERRDKEVIPALLRHDREKARKEIQNTLKPLYEAHRTAIDNVVKMANEKLRAQEIKVEEIIRNRALLLTVFAFLVIGSVVFCGIYANHIASTIIGRIGRVVAGLAESSGHISSSAGHLTTASQQLAEGASEQASSLEETSSSLEEMASMTKQNAENASQANQLMTKASGVVKRSDDSMNQLNSSMGEISRASEETQKIIKTIDEIAFQTNLLALNAAVEAARAGEVGAGFAVVADEVRNLAMRAADAAKNTAHLIEGTVKKIREGSELVARTNEEFKQVAAMVINSGELVEGIAAASQEQAQGIEQITKAVAEVDKVTQQNAANAEESASASEEMNAQAGQMKEFVETLVALTGGNGIEREKGR
jgi:ABC-type transporter Mla subunit MlaD